jgi:hypothetical protein
LLAPNTFGDNDNLISGSGELSLAGVGFVIDDIDGTNYNLYSGSDHVLEVSDNAYSLGTFSATAVPLETDAVPVVASAAFMAGGIWWKRRRQLPQ